jgi:hypothetical protein
VALQVAASTAEVNASGSADNLLRLNLSISEHGLEWAVSDESGPTRLVPE